ncbi:hypothetical protein COL922a_011422 [Colletotrichum nupharicola]|nr:hypothetical protein COL922a_011422 [Colletotrichum nupharicola]
MAAWQQWALEAFCDYPDNCYYGPGTGDAAGTKVDVPNGVNAVDQKKRLQAAAIQLREVMSPNLDKWVDASGNPKA